MRADGPRVGLAKAVHPSDVMRNRVADLRVEQQMTQGDLASAVGTSRQTIISIERGRYDPSLPLAFRIAELFELPIERIFASPTRR